MDMIDDKDSKRGYRIGKNDDERVTDDIQGLKLENWVNIKYKIY